MARKNEGILSTDTDTEREAMITSRASTFRPAKAGFAGSFAPGTRPTDVRLIPWWRDRDYLIGGWTDTTMWKSAWIEMTATAFLVYISGMIAGTLMSYETKQVGAYIGISSIFLIATFVYATAPVSGGHMNPMITFCVVLSGMCPVSRGIAYMLGQTLGAALGGGVLLGVWGPTRATQYYGGGCFYNTEFISEGQVFLNELFASLALLYLAYGVGLDPRQAEFFGPRMGPLLVGASLGVVAFATSGIVPGFAGAQMHPARCFGFGVAKRDMVGQWIWWFAPAIAAMLSALMYNMIPLHHADDEATREKEKEEKSEGASRRQVEV